MGYKESSALSGVKASFQTGLLWCRSECKSKVGGVVIISRSAEDFGTLAFVNPVQQGDHPDPTVIRVGEHDFWLATTSTNWAPAFPLLHSTDLVEWTVRGAVFHDRPEWSEGDYWAPELSEYKGTFYVYYVGRGHDGRLSIAVATAEQPQGPYQDHGPLVGQSDGSIDPMAFIDEHGQRHLFWKEDGNSVGNQTKIWVATLAEDGLSVTSAATEILVNDVPWEDHVVEAPFVMAKNGWYYLFYSGNACCGDNCQYAMGVARARNILGPWEKYHLNPILSTNAQWRCPGHGSIVDTNDGRSFLLYHCYAAGETPRAVGRQMLLDEVVWTADGWPSINGGNGPSTVAASPLKTRLRPRLNTIIDNFTNPELDMSWQWPYNQPPVAAISMSGLELKPQPSDMSGDILSAILARSPIVEDYLASAELEVASIDDQTWAGIAAYGDQRNAFGLAYSNGHLYAWRRRAGRSSVMHSIPCHAERVYVRLTVCGGTEYRLSYATDQIHWQDVGKPVHGGYLPPWDAGVRIALTVGGHSGSSATFRGFKIEPFVPNIRYIQPKAVHTRSTQLSAPAQHSHQSSNL